jgi:hypothetical protein
MRNTDEESTTNVLLTHRELDEHEKTDEEDKILQRWWLDTQQISEEEKGEEGDGDKSEKREMTKSCK